jgi:CDP-glycerol glycerophosphotransferase
MPELSVVVPIHNVEDYLAECLESIAGQTFADLEVIMVDDGSTDGSAVIAKAVADRDPRFRFVQQDNRGLGPARNTGVEHATGTFLAFADSDDIVPPDAYRLLVESLRASGSDLVSGNVRRFDGAGPRQSYLHRDLGKGETRTHVTRRPSLMRDCTAWNKVFRRAFWDEHGFSFPATLYEDAPVTIRAHVLAESVDVVPETVYLWRIRPGSISEHRSQAANVVARMESARTVRDALPPELVREYDRHFLLDISLQILLGALRNASPDDLPRLVGIAADFLAGIDPGLLSAMPAICRLRSHLIAGGMTDELGELLEFERRGLDDVPLVRRGERWYARYPFFESGTVPLDVYDVTAEMKAVAAVERAYWTEGGVLRVEGQAFIPGLAGRGRADLWFQAAGWLGSVGKRLERYAGVSGVGVVRVPARCEGGGFVAEIGPGAFRTLGRWRRGEWRLCVEIEAEGVRRVRTVRPPDEPPPERRLSRGLAIRPGAVDSRFVVRAVRPDSGRPEGQESVR